MPAHDRAGQAMAALRTRTFLPAVPDNSTDTTSGLTVDEQLAIAQVGYEPQDVVNGAAVVRLGYNGKNSLHPFRNYDVHRLSALLNNARLDAVREMEGQCAEIAAAGVIGVHLDLYGAEHDDLLTADRSRVSKNAALGVESGGRILTAKERKAPVIAFFGGSTVQGYGARLPQFSIPAQV